MTSIAVFQCVERGLVGLDEDVARILPELSEKDVIIAIDETTGQAEFQRSQKPLTLRYAERVPRTFGSAIPRLNGRS